ncbi:flagellar export chaperone FlgN [Alteromonas sp. KUL49]|uniref:flagellar export chaperone FlgN n=1 Tax=Alteromonas sp. KUL49 TaxID=2480798 RepID=UPI0035A5FD97
MNELASQIARQVEQLTLLGELLEKELHLISTRDAESLISLLEEKAALLEAIQQLDSQVEHSYTKANDHTKQSPEIEALLADAKAQLENCKYRTDVNEKAVEQGQLRLTHLRNLMLEVRAKESLTYDKKGKPKGGTLGSGISA